MSKLFRDIANIAYRGLIEDEALDKMLLADADKEIAEKEMMLAILEEKIAKQEEQRREQNLRNENKDE